MTRLWRIIGAAGAVFWFSASATYSEDVRAQCPPRSDATYYFPEDSFDSESRAPNPEWAPRLRDESYRAQFSRILSLAREPSLSCGAADAEESYRFTWSRSFHADIVIRIERNGSNVSLLFIAPYGPGREDLPASGGESQLGQSEWNTLQAALARADFWDTQTVLPCVAKHEDATCLDSGLDGANWVFEGRRGGDYHVVERWSPYSGPLRDLGLEFLTLAGVEIPPEAIY